MCAEPGAERAIREEAKGTEEPVSGGDSDEESSGLKTRQRVQTEHPQTEAEGDKRPTCPRYAGV